MKAWLRTALLGLGLGSIPAWGEPDSFGVGSGRDGPLTVSEPGRVINRYAQVSGPAAPGDTVLLVADSDGFAKGDLVMVLQATGLVPEPSPGGSKPIELSHDAVGQWEFARLSASGDGALTLTAPLVNAYAAQVTQVIRVPEYTQLRIREGAEVRAAPWNGRTGGVVALLATGAVLNEGTLSATGAGFRGGVYVPDSFEPALCLGMSVAARPGARKGEGIAVTQYGPATTGRESVSHGGGGGLCPLAGGGGGGNGGPGGRGGGSTELTGEALGLGGEGGAKLVYSLANRLSFGGGGGSGQGEDELRPEGGAGGGAMFIRAHQLSGRGVIVADGTPGGVAGRGGAGGGGAGGSIHLRFDASAECGGVFARGGAGGAASPYLMGAGVPGGGGGGGQILFQTASRGDCPLGVDAGTAGAIPTQTTVTPSRDEAQPSQDTSPIHSGVIHRVLGESYRGSAAQLGVSVEVTVPDKTIGYADAASGLKVGGKADPGGVVKVYINGAPVSKTTTANAQGNWELMVYKVPTGEDFVDHETYSVGARYSQESGDLPSHDFILDKIVPVATIVKCPDGRVKDSTVSFSYKSDNDPASDVEFECSLDSGSFQDCTSGGSITYNNLGSGNHRFRVRAEDKVHKETQVAHCEWEVDRTPPAITIDEKPNSRTKSVSAKFSFHANEDATFECGEKLNGVPTTTTPCLGSVTYSVAHGPHTFLLIARDLLGNESRETYSWEVDTRGPATTIGSRPSSPTKLQTAEFSFNADESGSTYKCALDTGAYEPCTSPRLYSGLNDGDHIFSVRAIDSLGNEGEPVSVSWKVDLTPPDTRITGFPDPLTTSTSANFEFWSTETNVRFECALDSGAFSDCGSSGATSLAGTKSYPFIGEGSHIFRVRSADALGNTDQSSAEYSWTVDTTPPTLDVEAPANEGKSTTPLVVVTGTTDKGNKVFVFFDDDTRGEQAKVDPFDGSWLLKASSPLSEARHRLRVDAVDWAGRTTSKVIYFTVNTFRPETEIVSGPSDPDKSSIAVFVFSAPNAREGDVVEFRCVLDGKSTECGKGQRFTELTDGKHTLTVYAVIDGNEDLSPASYTWEVRIERPASPEILEPVSGARVSTDKFVISGRSVPNGSVNVYIDDEKVKTGIAVTDSEGTWRFKPSSLLTPGEHIVRAEALDELGNISKEHSVVYFFIEIPSDIGGFGEGGGGLSCSAGGAAPCSMLLWGLLSLLGVRRRRC